MSDIQRIDIPLAGSEKEIMLAFLDWHRATLLQKVHGVSETDLRRLMTPSGLSLLGLVKHLAYVEMGWFQMQFAGEKHPIPYTDEDPNADFRIEAHETTADILAFYAAQVERSRAIATAASLDDLALIFHHETPDKAGQKPSLRWIIVHMIEETARHNGHADLMREAIDGSTGV
jgi:uncharacterized damage-inducible protein DinB